MPNGSRLVGIPGNTQRTVRGFSALLLLSTLDRKRGFFYRTWVKSGDRWTSIAVPATECPRIPPEFLEEEREVFGEQYFDQEYRSGLCHDTKPLFSQGL